MFDYFVSSYTCSWLKESLQRSVWFRLRTDLSRYYIWHISDEFFFKCLIADSLENTSYYPCPKWLLYGMKRINFVWTFRAFHQIYVNNFLTFLFFHTINQLKMLSLWLFLPPSVFLTTHFQTLVSCFGEVYCILLKFS